jgi:S-adenosylmethionine decarboxylase
MGYAMNALSPLGMVSELPSSNQMQSDAERTLPNGSNPNHPDMEVQKDYFVEKDGVKFAGMHLLVDLWGASNLCDPDHIDRALREAAEAAGATILHSHFHHFSPNGGVSGVLVLAESHISIHTWPERDFAAIDIFMCGACNPHDSIPALKAAFQPRTINLGEQRRGLIG